MEGEVLRDDQWERLKPFVPGGRKGRRGPRSDGRRFLTRCCGWRGPGARWRDLPADRFGPYQTVKRRYYRWVEQGCSITCSRRWRTTGLRMAVDRRDRDPRPGPGGRRPDRKRGDLRPRLSAARAAGSEPNSTP